MSNETDQVKHELFEWRPRGKSVFIMREPPFLKTKGREVMKMSLTEMGLREENRQLRQDLCDAVGLLQKVGTVEHIYYEIELRDFLNRPSIKALEVKG